MKSNIQSMEHLTPDECSPCLPAISTYLKQALALQQPEDDVSIPSPYLMLLSPLWATW